MAAHERGTFERIATVLHATLFVVIAATWTLSSVHAVARWPLVVTGALLVGIACAALVCTSRRHLNTKIPPLAPFAPLEPLAGMTWWLSLAVAVPLGAWLAYSAFRALVIPIGSHDALSYHLPRAVEITRAHAWHLLDVEDFRLRSFPANYELLLADVLALGGGEAGVQLTSIAIFTFTFVTFAAFTERHWGSSMLAIVAALSWAGTPLALLHTAAVKNDLLSAACAVGVALWGARSLTSLRLGQPDRRAEALCLIDLALGLGTKSTGVFPLAALLLVALSQASFRTFVQQTLRQPKRIAIALVSGLVLAFAAGATPYVAQLVVPAPPDALDAWALNIAPRWGAFAQLLSFPYLLLARPFSPSELAVFVPWRGEMWFWPKYEIYFGSFGPTVTVLLTLAPIAWYLRATSPETRRTERTLARLVLLGSAALLVPLHYRTDGFFNGFPRYVMYLPLLVVDAGLLPLLQRARTRWPTQLALVAIAAVFAVSAVDAGKNDRFAPFAYVMFAASHPGTRQRAFVAPRAELFVDEIAGRSRRRRDRWRVRRMDLSGLRRGADASRAVPLFRSGSARAADRARRLGRRRSSVAHRVGLARTARHGRFLPASRSRRADRRRCPRRTRF